MKQLKLLAEMLDAVEKREPNKLYLTRFITPD